MVELGDGVEVWLQPHGQKFYYVIGPDGKHGFNPYWTGSGDEFIGICTKRFKTAKEAVDLWYLT